MKESKFINIKGKLMALSSPKVMGIVNLTADSFYDGGKIKSDQDLLTKVEGMMRDGVDILDIGAYSSRPGATDIPMREEWDAAVSGIDLILDRFPEAIISIDTFRATVAKGALEHGACIVNDISGGSLDQGMFDVIESTNVPYIMMHMRGNPQTMANLTDYDHLVSDIIDYFNEKVAALRKRGVKDIIIDPGFGFAKTKEQNFELLDKLELLNMVGVPMLCGVSRKSMISKELDVSPDEALNGTTALNMACLMKGASMLRVHDVKEAKETIQLFEAMTKSKK
ncbi:dihydropteroate synthase [Reichenbachiella carrageenanivorans]|uniref:Dihydropteroate synthase n=1 Tax=Reichenbachiella carrageenanivorans TaxID=2979869 RepID=A0ABY6DAS2_9BACT|nr:dihydropteroate synthase [Reichenbachiella carrageenanivorans]UXX80945.1 dihydropteroate synthase [Reichenbachiella carrageenanivorans]